RCDVPSEHRALADVILDVSDPLFIRPHLPIHSLLAEVAIEIVRQQLSCGHCLSVLRVIAGELGAFVKVPVQAVVSQNGFVQFQLPRGNARARLRIECLNEHTKTPDHDNEPEARNKKLHGSKENNVVFIPRHAKASISLELGMLGEPFKTPEARIACDEACGVHFEIGSETASPTLVPIRSLIDAAIHLIEWFKTKPRKSQPRRPHGSCLPMSKIQSANRQ